MCPSVFVYMCVCLGVKWKDAGSCLQVDVIKSILLSEMVLGELKITKKGKRGHNLEGSGRDRVAILSPRMEQKGNRK